MPRHTKETIKDLNRINEDLRIAKSLISKAWGLLEGVNFTAEDLEQEGFAPILNTHDIDDNMQALDHVERHLAATIPKVRARLRRAAPAR